MMGNKFRNSKPTQSVQILLFGANSRCRFCVYASSRQLPVSPVSRCSQSVRQLYHIQQCQIVGQAHRSVQYGSRVTSLRTMQPWVSVNYGTCHQKSWPGSSVLEGPAKLVNSPADLHKALELVMLRLLGLGCQLDQALRRPCMRNSRQSCTNEAALYKRHERLRTTCCWVDPDKQQFFVAASGASIRNI